MARQFVAPLFSLLTIKIRVTRPLYSFRWRHSFSLTRSWWRQSAWRWYGLAVSRSGRWAIP